ncbi:MAG: hypothetical protein IJE60_10015 [Tyzzerella sp.]|nr:hypothetical protein [Tyzzerella sp.]
MKKKITIIVCAAVALLLCVVISTSILAGPEITALSASEKFRETSSDDSTWNVADTGSITIENDDYSLSLDSETTHFTITHKSSGKIYRSVPQDSVEFEPEYLSEVIIHYYDSNSKIASMSSYENSVEGKSYEIKTDGDSIRVYYSIQKSKKQIFVPEVIGQETFEEEILTKLESGPKRRLKGFYNLYESDGTDSNTKEMKNKYPALERENLYVLGDKAGEHNYSEISGYMENANFDMEAYAKEVERLGLDSSISANQPAGFVVPVEYALDENGLVATILTDKITSDSDSYKLTNIALLPYFTSVGETQEGWFMVPDGSGAIIELSEKAGNTYSQKLWGTDLAVESSVKSNIMQNAGLPVFGFHSGDKAFLAEVTSGAAVANVDAEVYGNEILQNHIYAAFDVLSFDTSDTGELRNQAVFNIYASDYIAEFPQIRYHLFANADTTYSDMANHYREVLNEKGVLGERLEKNEAVPVYMDFTGYETVDQSFLGISTKAEITLSTIEDIEKSVEEFESRGLKGMNLRMKAYGDNGIYNTLPNGFELNHCVGDIEELDALAQRMEEAGGRLYLDNHIGTVYTEGNSFQKMTHAVRSLKKTVVEAFDFDLIARTKGEAVMEYYLISPAYFGSLTSNFVQELSKESKDASAYGYSWSGYGSALWSDFRRSDPYDRAQAIHAANEAVKSAGEVFGDFLTDGSNAYALPYATALLNVPLTASQLSCESYSIPFYQMVVHGYIDYAGAPLNTGGDIGKTYLATVESGANPYYTFYTSEDEPLKETLAGTLMYPTLASASYDAVEQQYKEFSSVFADLRSQTITGHERVAEQTFVTTYENGTQIAVNYSDTEMQVGEVAVPANGYAVVERGK